MNIEHEFKSTLFPQARNKREYLNYVVKFVNTIYDIVKPEVEKQYPDYFMPESITDEITIKQKVLYTILVEKSGYNFFEYTLPENFFVENLHIHDSQLGYMHGYKTQIAETFVKYIYMYMTLNLHSETGVNRVDNNAFIYCNEIVDEMIGFYMDSYEDKLIAETRVFFESWIIDSKEIFLCDARPKGKEIYRTTYSVVSPNTIAIDCTDELITTQLYMFLEFYQKSLEDYAGYRIYLTINGFSCYDLRTLYSGEYPRLFRKEFCTKWLKTLIYYSDQEVI